MFSNFYSQIFVCTVQGRMPLSLFLILFHLFLIISCSLDWIITQSPGGWISVTQDPCCWISIGDLAASVWHIMQRARKSIYMYMLHLWFKLYTSRIRGLTRKIK